MRQHTAADDDNQKEPELDPDEGADAFETREDAQENEHRSDAERDDQDHISLDSPD